MRKLKLTYPEIKDFKVVYIDPRNPLYIYSTMYDNENDALFGIQNIPDGMEFLIMELKDYNENGFEWEILPYGYYKKYQTALWIYERKFLLLLFLLIIYLITKK